jgi:hypothetical protein
MANILFLGGGRRVELARLFKVRGHAIFGYETSTQVPLASEAQIVRGLPWADTGLAASLSDACRVHGIDLLLPLDCRAVAELASLRTVGERERTARIVHRSVSENLMFLLRERFVGPDNEETATACLDKGLFEAFIVAHFGFDTDLYPFPVSGKPAIIKPRRGFGSRGVMKVGALVPDSVQYDGDEDVAQVYLPGTEWSVDAYFGLRNADGASGLLGASPRQRLRVAGGEVIESVTVDRPDLVSMTKEVGEALRLTGPACFQFKGDVANSPRLIEVNARFGGGATLSIEAGLPMVGYVCGEYLECRTFPAGSGCARQGVYMSRSYRDHYWFHSAKQGEAI